MAVIARTKLNTELVEDVLVGRGRVEGLVQLAGDGVEPVLHRGIADAEEALHLLDGAVVADEGHDEGLVLHREPGQGGDLEIPLQPDVAGRADHPGDGHGAIALATARLRDIHINLPFS